MKAQRIGICPVCQTQVPMSGQILVGHDFHGAPCEGGAQIPQAVVGEKPEDPDMDIWQENVGYDE